MLQVSEEAEGTPSVEAALHPQSRSCLANESNAPFDWPEFDAGRETPPENQHKDIGEYQSRLPTEIPLSLESCEQEILQKLLSVIGDEEMSESKLQFAPPRIIEKAKARDFANYKDSVQMFGHSSLPRSANIVSSHHSSV